jgi:hypothetical protein
MESFDNRFTSQVDFNSDETSLMLFHIEKLLH